MLRPTVFGLLLACAVSLCSSAVFLENGMPILWAQTAGQVTDLPIQNGILTPDPWHFLQRMSLYRLMIAATDPFMGSMGTNATDSPVWGLPLQLGWMLTTGRLADPTSATTCGLQTGDTTCISTQSWWACVSYFVSALPFLSAAQQGFMGEGVQVQMQVPEGVTDYCTTYTDCAARYPDAMSKWDAFFQGLKSSADSPLPENEKKDALLGLYWAAQMASIYASAACNAKQSHYSAAEVSFANSWLNSAEYVSAAHFHSNLEKSAMFMSPLPSRILKDGDNAPNIADLSQEENHTLSIFSWMTSVNKILGGTLVHLWRSAMCSVNTREKGREMLEQLLLNPNFATNTFLSIITGMTTSC
ncbi:protein LEG1 homolog [Micropterus dolomieu]|uniref:protein LEG1 homolog n=1 Tax=Micropterus dolomieu TaxID=147949 RepID=UPI001E8E32D0|nr:protein LEG1 homolog [Micropterus dolomieu]XP_045916549.1 protein LEG1 homolog [Micropterus dolomieu]XP_045916550.1 protein LEG1 homolog [Micropterus dolomieu]XP_045916551.1 protein LEG1 homolog [Micropterus dolomieu]